MFSPIKYFQASLHNNWGQVTPLIYRSAQLNKRELKEVRQKYNITLNLNLQATLPDEEFAEVTAADMELIWVPMSDKRAPLPAEIANALRVMRDPRIKLVNCRGGRHRTGLVVACYRTVVPERGYAPWSKELAWEEAEHYNFYSTFGHGPLKEWFFDEFKPEDYRDA